MHGAGICHFRCSAVKTCSGKEEEESGEFTYLTCESTNTAEQYWNGEKNGGERATVDYGYFGMSRFHEQGNR